MKTIHYAAILIAFAALWLEISCTRQDAGNSGLAFVAQDTSHIDAVATKQTPPRLDTARYDSLMQYLANGDTTGKWPAEAAHPLPNPVLPFHRVVAYYGNLYSKHMGILGALPKAEMLQKLQEEVAKWNAADSIIPAMPALHYIAVTAQEQPGKGGKYRLRMPFHQIDTVLSWAKEINALTFLDIQVGHSDVRTETYELEPYLKMPNVHLGIDPEFSMKNGNRPGVSVGTFHAADVNDVIDTLAKIVQENKLPPKILIVHRFTMGMLQDYQDIKTVPEVQVVINMDGFGAQELKTATWFHCIYRQPVQFAGFKIFYYNDSKGSNELFTPEQLLHFRPKPIYIQYQ